MKKLVFSPEYKEKLTTTKKWLDARFGIEVRKKAMIQIKERLSNLKQYPDSGLSVREMFGIDSDYEFLFVAHNYIFYFQDGQNIYVVNIYDEREDFMYGLFGIKTVSDD